MTLEEFRNKMRPLSHYSKRELINAAWEEATKAGRKAEREECVRVCEDAATAHRDGFGYYCAAMIRTSPKE